MLIALIGILSLCICVSEVEYIGTVLMTYEDTDMYKLKKLVNVWFRTPPLTEPEENALVCEPTVRMMGTVDFHAPSDSAL